MFLKSWAATVAPFRGNSHLQVTIQATCQCGAVKEIESQSYTVGQGWDLDYTVISWVINDVGEQQPCGSCGLVTVLPDDDKERLRSEMNETITHDWISAQCRKTA